MEQRVAEKTGGAAETFAHVLNPTDFSKESFPAFAHALRIGLAAKGAYTLVHVASGDESKAGGEWAQFPKVREQLSAWGLLPAGAPQEDVVHKLGLQVTKADFGHPEPAHAVAKYVERHRCDLIVMGTHARDGLDLWLKGSIAADLAREARTPALFVPNDAEGFVDPASGAVRMKNILVPIDDHPNAAEAARLARAMADLFGEADAMLHFLHVGREGAVAPPADAGRSDSMFMTGDVAEAISAAALQVSADLIVMATEGRHGFLDAIRGSTTEQVIRKAGRAVLAVPA